MVIFQRLPTHSKDRPGSATRVETRMSDQEKEQELERLRQSNNQTRTKEEQAHYQKQLKSMKSRGIPLRLQAKNDWEERRARIQQRKFVA